MKIQAKTKTELAALYNVSVKTFMKWIVKIPGLNLLPRQRILTPKQVGKVYEHLGLP